MSDKMGASAENTEKVIFWKVPLLKAESEG